MALDTSTIILLLLASLLHASWHSLVKYGADQVVVLAGMGLVATAVTVCVLPFLSVPPLHVWPVIAGAVVLHVGYKFALARSYAFGDLGQAYPLARGFVPIFSTLIAFVFLSQVPSTNQLFGIALVSVGLIWLSGHAIRRGVDPRLFLAAMVAGCTVAGYSVIDAYGTRLNGDWASFTAWLIVADSATFMVLIYGMRGQRLWGELWRIRRRVLLSGALGLISFSVFLWALSRSPVGPVSALRESSVLFATIIGLVLHRESKSPQKLAAAGLIAGGLFVIAILH
jgi:drug/metabolite transporter (DMT)-like permease